MQFKLLGFVTNRCNCNNTMFGIKCTLKSDTAKTKLQLKICQTPYCIDLSFLKNNNHVNC